MRRVRERQTLMDFNKTTITGVGSSTLMVSPILATTKTKAPLTSQIARTLHYSCTGNQKDKSPTPTNPFLYLINYFMKIQRTITLTPTIITTIVLLIFFLDTSYLLKVDQQLCPCSLHLLTQFVSSA